MILRFYPTKDATIYENDPERNTGRDQVLELIKVGASGSVSGAVTASYNSRILLDFDYTSISASIVSLGYDPNDFDFGIKLFATEAEEIPIEYSLEAYPISGSWEMGVGRSAASPADTEGVSWYYRAGKIDLFNIWATSSYAAQATASWQVNPGGGNWYTSSAASQSFDYTTTDVDMDITAIVRQVQSGSIDFNGIIIKKNEDAEQNLQKFKKFQFYSKETQTIYSPVIEARYDDSIITGSLSIVDTEEEFNIVCTNLRERYKEGARPKLTFAPRYRYPTAVYQTSSLFLDQYRLPSGSQYAVYYAHSDDSVIDFSNYTHLSHDNKGSYVKLHLDSFQPERYYRLLVKVPQEDGVNYNIYDQNWIFKIERN
jgi:hypothetical protein